MLSACLHPPLVPCRHRRAVSNSFGLSCCRHSYTSPAYGIMRFADHECSPSILGDIVLNHLGRTASPNKSWRARLARAVQSRRHACMHACRSSFASHLLGEVLWRSPGTQLQGPLNGERARSPVRPGAHKKHNVKVVELHSRLTTTAAAFGGGHQHLSRLDIVVYDGGFVQCLQASGAVQGHADRAANGESPRALLHRALDVHRESLRNHRGVAQAQHLDKVRVSSHLLGAGHPTESSKQRQHIMSRRVGVRMAGHGWARVMAATQAEKGVFCCDGDGLSNRVAMGFSFVRV